MRHAYRVLNQSCHLGEFSSIVTVYYDEDGNIDGWSDKAETLSADDRGELKADMELMMKAFDKPTLYKATVGGEEVLTEDKSKSNGREITEEERLKNLSELPMFNDIVKG